MKKKNYSFFPEGIYKGQMKIIFIVSSFLFLVLGGVVNAKDVVLTCTIEKIRVGGESFNRNDKILIKINMQKKMFSEQFKENNPAEYKLLLVDNDFYRAFAITDTSKIVTNPTSTITLITINRLDGSYSSRSLRDLLETGRNFIEEGKKTKDKVFYEKLDSYMKDQAWKNAANIKVSNPYSYSGGKCSRVTERL